MKSSLTIMVLEGIYLRQAVYSKQIVRIARMNRGIETGDIYSIYITNDYTYNFSDCCWNCTQLGLRLNASAFCTELPVPDHSWDPKDTGHCFQFAGLKLYLCFKPICFTFNFCFLIGDKNRFKANRSIGKVSWIVQYCSEMQSWAEVPGGARLLLVSICVAESMD